MRFLSGLIVSFFLCMGHAAAASEAATFESFYGDSTSVYWDVGLSALITAGCSILTLPAPPLMPVAIGAAFDYAGGNAFEAYNYARFAERSNQMVTLPLPRNTSGPDSYDEAMDVLDELDPTEPPYGRHYKSIVSKAILAMESSDDGKQVPEEQTRRSTLLALLHFISGDYRSARKYAESAFTIGRTAKLKTSLPAFILATSMLYDEKINLERTLWYLGSSLQQEPENALTPLMFRVFLDRLSYRLNEGDIPPESLMSVFDLSEQLPLDHRKAAVQSEITKRLISRLEDDRNTVVGLSGSINLTIKNNPGTLKVVREAHNEFSSLIPKAQALLSKQDSNSTNGLHQHPRYLEKLWDQIRASIGYKTIHWAQSWKTEISGAKVTLMKLSDDRKRLSGFVESLEKYQRDLETSRHAKTNLPPAKTHNEYGLFWSIFGLVIILVGPLLIRPVRMWLLGRLQLIRQRKYA